MKKFNEYKLNEHYNTGDPKVGDEVILQGIVSSKDINNVRGTITESIKNSDITTNYYENGETKRYRFKGTIYHISPLNWYVTKFNIVGYTNDLEGIDIEKNDQEEDNKWWLNENLDMSVDEIKNCIFEFHSLEEMISTAKFLHSKGLQVHNYREVIKKTIISRTYDEEGFYIYDGYGFSRTSMNDNYRFNANIKEIIRIANYKRKKRKSNLEEDPFGEENWGYVQESISYKEVKIGLEVKHLSYHLFGIGVIKHIDENDMVYIEFENETSLNRDYCKQRHGWMTNKNNILRDYEILGYENKRRKLNLEDDPFGEEDWGYVQESIISNISEIQVGNKIIHKLHKELGIGEIKGIDNDGEDVYIEFEIRTGFNRKYCRDGHGWFTDSDKIIKNGNYELLFSNRKKILNLEDDPFGEENWGYLDESVISNYKDLINFDIVFDNVEEMKEIAKILKENGYDVFNYDKIIAAQDMRGAGNVWNFYTMVDYDNPKKMTRSSGEPKVGKLLYFHDLLKFSSKKRKLNLEDDPFGEENWGFVQESNLTLDDFKIGDIVEIDEEYVSLNKDNLTKNDTSALKKSDGGKGTILNIRGGDYPIRIMWHKNDQIAWYKPNEIKLTGGKIRKKILNLEDDPFGEENWGFVQESLEEFNVGDVVKIKIGSDYMEESFEDGGQGIGDILSIINGIARGDTYVIKWRGGIKDYYRAVDLEKMNTKPRKLNLEEDPFGEEDWGYVQEQMNMDEFEIGDIVKIKDGTSPVIVKYKEESFEKGGTGIGEIVDIMGNDEVKLYFVRWKGGIENVYVANNLEKIKKSRKLNLKYDPFGEENWIQESLKIENIKPGDRVKADLDGFKIPYDLGGNGLGTFIRSQTNAFLGSTKFLIKWDNGIEGLYSGTLITKIDDKERKRILNPEDDPFGEEDWGYVQEKIDVSKLEIGDRVEHACGTLGTITAKSFRLVGIVWDNGEKGVYTGSIITKIGDSKKRKLNLDQDPFGEENWFEE